VGVDWRSCVNPGVKLPVGSAPTAFFRLCPHIKVHLEERGRGGWREGGREGHKTCFESSRPQLAAVSRCWYGNVKDLNNSSFLFHCFVCLVNWKVSAAGAGGEE